MSSKVIFTNMYIVQFENIIYYTARIQKKNEEKREGVRMIEWVERIIAGGV